MMRSPSSARPDSVSGCSGIGRSTSTPGCFPSDIEIRLSSIPNPRETSALDSASGAFDSSRSSTTVDPDEFMLPLDR
jgi:hypothetical protein